jgi:phytoene synthase
MTGAIIERPREAAREVLAKNSKSFALAAKLLPARVASNVVVLYAYCRRADDAIDNVPPAEQPARLAALRSELDALYARETPPEASLATFQQVLRDCEIPREYLDELLLGMEMDVNEYSYSSFSDLALYGHRVAGVVGLMMCHVMGVRRDTSLEHAAHLGIGMQLTNIARDVWEDWQRGRLYLPDDMLHEAGARDLRAQLGRPFPRHASPAVARVTRELLDRADLYYASGDRGVRDLSLRCGLAVRTARLVYSAIGDRIRANDCDPFAGRAVVPKSQKLRLAARAACWTACSAPLSLLRPTPQIPRSGFLLTNLVL